MPEPAELAELEAAARAAYAVPPVAEIVATPGTQAIIQMLPRLVRAARVGILGPIYSEHAKSWRSHGATVIDVTTWTELEDCDAGVIVNRNKPDGRLIAPDILVKLAASFAARGGLWAVSGPAIGIGRRALAGRSWRTGATRCLADDSHRLDDQLRSAGFTLLGGTPLFRLVSSDLAEQWFETLCRHGILVRPFGARRNLLRFGIPGDQPEWARLAAALNGAAS